MNNEVLYLDELQFSIVDLQIIDYTFLKKEYYVIKTCRKT